MSRPILVTGATGRQGGAVARHLHQLEAPVRALTRRPESASALELAAQGIEVVQGDFGDPASLRRALEGTRAVFSVQDFWQAGAEGEVRQGTALATAAADAGVVVVQSTMARAASAGPEAPMVDHFASKRAVERELTMLGVPHVLLGTVFFMDNVLDPAMGGRMTLPSLAGTLRGDTAMEMVAVNDVGAVAARILVDPEPFLGQRVDVVGDRLTVAEMRATSRRVTGRRPRWGAIPSWLMRRLNREFHQQLVWQNEVGFDADRQLARRLVPELETFEAFLRRTGVTGL